MDQTLRFLQQENARLQTENQELRDEIRALQEYLDAVALLDEAAGRLSSEQELIPLLDKIFYYVLTVLDASDGSIALLDEENDRLIFTVVQGQVEKTLVNYQMPRDQGIIGWVVQHGEPVISNDIEQDPRFSPQVDELFGFETCSMLCVPLQVEGTVLGAISAINKHSGTDFSPTDQSLLSILGRVAAQALHRFN